MEFTLGSAALEPFYRRWKTIEDMSDILKDRMKDEAKENAFKLFLYRYGVVPARSFDVDVLRRFTKYHDW